MKSILIVDDQPGIRLLLSDVFSNKGYNVLLAENGEVAIKKITENSIDLIILDYWLPIVSGEEVLQYLEEENMLIPVIFISGFLENFEEKFKKYKSPYKVLSKPFNIEKITSIAAEMLQDKMMNDICNSY